MIFSIFILLLLTESYSSISSNVPGCTILTIYCKADPTCLDEKVFLEKCLLKNDLRISTWIENNHSFKTNTPESGLWHERLLEDFQEQLQEQEIDFLTQHVLKEQFTEDILNIIKSIEKRKEERDKLLDLFNKYQEESIRESKQFKLKEKEQELNNNKQIKTNSHDISFLNNAYDTLLSLFNDLKKSHNHKNIQFKNFTKENNIREGKNSSKVFVKNIVEDHIIRISVGSGSDRTSFDSLNKDILDQREDKSVQDIQDKGYLTIQTSQRLNISSAIKLVHQLQLLFWNIKPSTEELFHIHKISNKLLELHLTVHSSSEAKKVENTSILAERLNKDNSLKKSLKSSTGVEVISAVAASINAQPVALTVETEKKNFNRLTIFTTVIGVCTIALVIIAGIVFVLRRHSKGNPVDFKKQEAVQDYQELCRTQMSVVTATDNDDTEKDGNMKGNWNEDSFPYNMDISTGHVILSYMEDHLKNEDRLNNEWKGLCSYKADDATIKAGSDPKNSSKNRYRDVLPFDHTRVKLHETSNTFHSDYINASFIADINRHHPEYIATQGPLDNTVSDFWQMVWEHGVNMIVNLTKLSDVGLPQCHRYWPESGSQVYHIYEVNLISEHIWCDDYLVRSLYLKNLQTSETRTVTQFHYLTWPDLSVPSSPKHLLEFRRKVNKSYRGHACPIIVHCNNGVGRTGTYILLDMVLNKMIKGAKEMDIAASLEHIRDQRPDMVKTKGQFEFVLTSVAEEVTTILSSVPQ